MIVLGVVLLLIYFLVAHAEILLILAIVALAVGLLGNGYASTRPAGGRRRYFY